MTNPRSALESEMLEALKGVVRVADRATMEFDAARAVIARAEARLAADTPHYLDGWELVRKAAPDAGGWQLPDIETVSAEVHAAWMESKRAQGWISRRGSGGEELMVPYDELSEPAKDLDRATVRAVYAAIERSAPPRPPAPKEDRRSE